MNKAKKKPTRKDLEQRVYLYFLKLKHDLEYRKVIDALKGMRK